MSTLLSIVLCLSVHNAYAGFSELDQSGQSCRDLGDCRSIWDIVWSCLATIFSCAWVSLHLNVPKQGKGTLWKIGRHAVFFITALISPELMIAFAHKQRAMAKKIAAEHKDHHWTLAHGFFANMGGFMIYDANDDENYLLHPNDIGAYLRDGRIKITTEEIKDKSKGDALTKGFVVVQTTWFILQLVARILQRLSITELEVVTLAFAILNGATYALWWEKPLDVQYPIILTKSAGSMAGDATDREEGDPENRQPEHRMRRLSSLKFSHPGVRNEEYRSSYHILAAIGMLFGGIHCISWVSHFPTFSEKLTWQIASMTTVVLPLVVAVTELLTGRGSISKNTRNLTLAFLLVLYPVARLLLLVLAFTTLRSVPPDTYTTIRWTAFIPHM